jgi:adenylate cyclase
MGLTSTCNETTSTSEIAFPRLVEHTPPVEPSEEIQRIIARFTRAIAEGDNESALARLSEQPGTLITGSDASEWWHGRETREVWARQMEEVGPFPVTAEEIEAWEEGTVGWAAVKEAITWEGTAIESRATYVLRLEHGEWKIVQVHWSFPRPNLEIFGRVLTVTLEELEKAVQREKPDLSNALDADGTVTIAFTDIVDSTVLVARLGDHAWLDLLRRHDAVIGEATAAHGGTVVQTQGDGAMLAFPSARRATRCAQAIQREISLAFPDDSPPIRVRIGIHTGDALHAGDQFFGTTVHYAARVASHALGGEVLVSNVVRELVTDPGIDFHESRTVELKGLDGLHRLFAIALT